MAFPSLAQTAAALMGTTAAGRPTRRRATLIQETAAAIAGDAHCAGSAGDPGAEELDDGDPDDAHDGQLQRVIDAWPKLSLKVRNQILELVPYDSDDAEDGEPDLAESARQLVMGLSDAQRQVIQEQREFEELKRRVAARKKKIRR